MSDEELDDNKEAFGEEDPYGVSQEEIRQIEEALEEEQLNTVRELIEPLDAQNTAVVIEYLPYQLRQEFVELIRDEFDPHILPELEETVRDEVVSQLGVKDLAAALANLESDDSVALVEHLDEDMRLEVLSSMPISERVILEEVLTYPEDSAARLMQREVVCIPSFWTIGDALNFLSRSSDLPEKIYDVFVVDPKHAPIGSVHLSALLRTPKTAKISEAMTEDVKSISVNTDQEEVAMLFRKYNLISAPVVDEAGRIVGMITIDDVVDVIDEEAEEDIMRLNRVAESDFFAPLWQTSYKRIRWLIVTMVNTLIAAGVVKYFESSIEELAVLAVLMPVNAAMGGNSGMQTVTVTVRALATRELGLANMWRAINKEVGVGILNGLFFGLVMAVIAGFWLDNPMLGGVLGIALVFNMLWAAFAGVLLPIIIDKLDMDPAISAGPFLTTTTDVLGYAIFLGLASFFLL
jgi:magnesium transporter